MKWHWKANEQHGKPQSWDIYTYYLPAEVAVAVAESENEFDDLGVSQWAEGQFERYKYPPVSEMTSSDMSRGLRSIAHGELTQQQAIAGGCRPARDDENCDVRKLKRACVCAMWCLTHSKAFCTFFFSGTNLTSVGGGQHDNQRREKKQGESENRTPSTYRARTRTVGCRKVHVGRYSYRKGSVYPTATSTDCVYPTTLTLRVR